MRAAWWVPVLLSLAFAGCVDGPAPEPGLDPERKVGEQLPPDDPLTAYTWNGTNLIYDELEPPVPTHGTYWRYAAGGVWSLVDEMTVVVIQKEDGGIVFGAARQEQLHNTAIWDQYWYGPMKDLNPTGLDTGLFDWPLHDGKTFTLHSLTMHVVADLIDSPAGVLPGYRIEGDDGEQRRAYTFVPQLGYLTSYWHGPADGSEPWETLELTSFGTTRGGVTLERGTPFSYATHEPPAGLPGPNATIGTYEVPPGYDHLLFVGLGTAGAGVMARSLEPTGADWAFRDAEGLWDWQVGRTAATPGTWLMTTHKGPDADAWAYFEGVPVRWVSYLW